ncbi:MAG TPA: hypothetical protein VNO31_24425 [Umezawaea sp.]|nr:hypothetical protein [Umezawaea sp.]
MAEQLRHPVDIVQVIVAGLASVDEVDRREDGATIISTYVHLTPDAADSYRHDHRSFYY